MSALSLRRGTVTEVETGADQDPARVLVLIDGELRPALAFLFLTGPVETGDDVVVNTAAVDLGLGSGGLDVLHVNLSRGLGAPADPARDVMKLNYTSLQHGVKPVEERAPAPRRPLDRPVAVLALHGQLAPVAWAAARTAPGRRVGFVQGAGGALPGGLSRTVARLRRDGLLAGHVTAAPAFGGEEESMTVAGGMHAGLSALGWDAAIAGPGPGIVGSATELGHGGLAALDAAHAALALGCRTLVVPRMSSGDERPRHRGLSHHTATVLSLLLGPVIVPVPSGEAVAGTAAHDRREVEVDIEGYRRSGLPLSTMGRSIDEDDLFFRAALAGGAALGSEMHGL